MKKIRACLFTMTIFVVSQGVIASEEGGKRNKVNTQTSQSGSATLININNMSMWIHSNGSSSINPTGNSGVVFPRQTAGVIFADGIIWGGMVVDGREPLIRAGGQTYSTGTVPGRIIAPGISDSQDRIWRVRRDYMTADLRLDAAEVNQILTGQVTDAQIEDLRNQYVQDWLQWPADQGAPFYDADNDGVYSPEFFTDGSPKLFPDADEPGLQGADQVVWLVVNDLDSNTTASLYGSPPIGLEMQITLWGYDNQIYNDVIFKRYRLIYKGTASTPANAFIDSMYISQWSDPDLGSFGDDFIGYDPVTGLAYVYNSTNEDVFFAKHGLPPPAAGYDLLQGPIVTSVNAEGIFDFRKITGSKNLQPTTFAGYWAGGSDSNPTRGGDYNGTLQWWNMLRGFRPRPESPSTPWLDPNGNVTKFILTGDPVTGTGWIDSNPGDRRLYFATGPFTMAFGDTQEVVIALVGGTGRDHLNNINIMKNLASQIQTIYDNLLLSSPPVVSTQVEFTGVNPIITIRATQSSLFAATMTASFVTNDGIEVFATELYDDGQHNDDLVGDGIFANSITVTPYPDGLFLNLTILDNASNVTELQRIEANITTSGPLSIIEPQIFSDHLNSDGIVNPGENVRYGFLLNNPTSFNYEKIRVSIESEFEGKTPIFENLPAQSDIVLEYAPDDPNSYLTFQAPNVLENNVMYLFFRISDNRHNVWQDTLSFEIQLPATPFEFEEAEHISGKATGNFGVRIVDATQVKNHLYVIRGVDSIDDEGNSGFTLKDSTNGNILLENRPLPLEIDHEIPVIEGFKITKGSLIYELIGREWLSEGERWITGGNRGGSLLFGGVFLGSDFWGESTVHPAEYVSLQMDWFEKQGYTDLNENGQYDIGEPYQLADDAGQIANGYATWGGGNHLVTGRVPFTAFDVDSDPPRQLSIIWRDRDTNLQWDLHKLYDPADINYVDVNGGDFRYNYIFILNTDYDPTGDDWNPNNGGRDFMEELLYNGGPVLWVLWLDQRGAREPLGAPFTLTLIPNYVVTSRDVYTFNPKLITGILSNNVPLEFELTQNYPNPFNPETNIRFSLPNTGHVELKIYNILGQEVVTLLNQEMVAGSHAIQWNGQTKAKVAAPSGIYFYKLKTGENIQAKKMVLVR